MTRGIFSWILIAAFLFGMYRFGVWLLKDPEGIATKYFYYDRYLKPGNTTLAYFRALGAFFNWFAVFGAGFFVISATGSFFSSPLIGVLLFLITLAWLIGSFFVSRALRKRELGEQLSPTANR